MIAASVPAEVRGAAFGFHRALDHAGAVVGALAATTVLLWISTDPRMVFGLAAVPAAAAVLVLFLGLRERPVPVAPPRDPGPQGPTGSLPRLLVPIALFTLGNGSEVFLLFKAHAARIPLAAAPLLWTGLHVVKALTSFVGGSLADRIGRRRTLALGWVLHAAVFAGLAFAERPVLVAALFLAHGLYSGLGESAERALVADLVPRARWGGGYGWYHLVAGALTLAASVLFGAVWEIAGSHSAFLLGAAVTVAALGLLAFLSDGKGRRGQVDITS